MSYWTRDSSSSNPSDSPDESQLVKRAHAGDQLAFEVLYERYNTRICRYLSRMTGNDGQDPRQERGRQTNCSLHLLPPLSTEPAFRRDITPW